MLSPFAYRHRGILWEASISHRLRCAQCKDTSLPNGSDGISSQSRLLIIPVATGLACNGYSLLLDNTDLLAASTILSPLIYVYNPAPLASTISVAIPPSRTPGCSHTSKLFTEINSTHLAECVIYNAYLLLLACINGSNDNLLD